jgi:hypothetical protein
MRKILLTGAAIGALSLSSLQTAQAQLAQAQMDNANVLLQTSGPDGSDVASTDGQNDDADGQSLGSLTIAT